MKKILYLSQLFPSPPDSGGKIKSLNTVLTLAKKYKVFAVFISEEKPSATDIKVLTRAGIVVKIFYSPTILASVKDDVWGLFKNFVRGIPHYVFQYTHPPASQFIHQKIKNFQPNIIHVDHLNLAQYLPEKKQQTWILEHHNVETYLYWTRFAKTTKLTRKLYLLLEMLLTYFFEKRTLPKFDHIFAISKPEEKRLRSLFHIQQVSTQPLVFPANPVKRTPQRQPYILYVGGLGWPPNEDAVSYFLQKILPLIMQELPRTQFHVVGRSHPPFEKTLPPQKNVFFHGYQRDLVPFMKKTTVFVLPIRMGGGIRLKAFTALSAGVPMVSTPLGVDGLGVKHTRECLIVNEPEKFAKAVVRVARSKKLQQSLRHSALAYMERVSAANGNQEFLRTYETVTTQVLEQPHPR